MAAAGELTEPFVLAATKQELFAGEPERGYVVADTQFAQDRWLKSESIDQETKSILAPFNHVRVGSGFPDMVGVDHLDDDLLAVDRLGDEPPLIAIEAKGYTQTGGVDVERGILQAYDRLHEANVAYVTAPRDAITQPERTLARELNVGILGIDSEGESQVLERPRIVGNRTSDEATALRFQAGAQGVADKSFGLNHPKNYLAVPIAVYHDDPAESLVDEHVVSAVDDAIRGALFLGLVTEEGPDLRLTTLGEEVVRFALREYSGVKAALAEFETWKRSRKRFTEVAPKWGELTRRIVFEYPATELLVEELQQMHDDGFEAPTLVEFVQWLHTQHPTLTVELFVRGDEGIRERVLTEDGELQADELQEGDVYHSPTVFQLKAMLSHAGILTERGSEPSNLDPTADVWQLRESLSRWR
jgi:hypothetical protein